MSDTDELERLRAQLQEALVCVRLVAEEWYVNGEMYEQCFFCGARTIPDDPDDLHYAHCPVPLAKKLLSQMEASKD